MKGFPQTVDGPLGPWFKRVQEAVSTVEVGATRHGVLAALGPPDEVQRYTAGPGKQLQELMENVAGGETLFRYGDKEPFAEILRYQDPYRPRRWYAFGIRQGVVDAIWRDTMSAG